MKSFIQKKIAALRSNIHDQAITQQVFRDNEVKANLLIARALVVAAGILGVCWLLNVIGILAISSKYVLPIFLVGFVTLVIPAGICLLYRGEKLWIKYVLIITTTVVLAYLDAILTFNAALLIVLPVIFSCRYYSSSITIKTGLLTSVAFAASAWLGAVLNFNNPDLNFANADMRVYVRDVMLLSFLPKWLIFTVVTTFCYEIARYGRKMVLKQDEITQKTARVETELAMAAHIQAQALPDVSELPGNAYRHFDLAARMTPAKRVGGDFYDFFCPDPEHLVMIIADVADKGIAASLFMMMSKTLLDSTISATRSPAEVLETVNRQLYANSPSSMFVTVWLGILNLQTGDMVAANAGHEYPALLRQNSDFDLLHDKHGFVLGGLEAVRYKEYQIHMETGDTLFVYTDGVTEANDINGQMFGTDRVLKSLNRHKDKCMRELIDGVSADIESFTAGTSQADDTTMLAFQLGEKKTTVIS